MILTYALRVIIALCILFAVTVIGVLIYIFAKGSVFGILQKGGVIKSADILEIQHSLNVVDDVVSPITKMVIAIEHNGAQEKYSVIADGRRDLPIGSPVKVAVNFNTGECGLYE